MNAAAAEIATGPSSTAASHPKSPPAAHKINIVIDDRKYVVTEDMLTGQQLKTLANIPEANQLFLETQGHRDDEQVFDDKPFTLKSGMKFYDVPVGNLG